MKNFILALSLTLAIGTVFTLNSCKKTSTADDSLSAKDNNSINNAVNATTDDATSVAGQANISGKTDGLWQVLCGSTIVDSVNTGAGWKYTITYDGSSICNGVKRSGSVTVQLSPTTTHWKDAGAQIIVTINNLVITDPVTNESYTINGTHTITNETGGLAWRVAVGLDQTTVTHRNISTNMTITFSDGSQRTWNVDRTRSWSGAGGVITVSIYTENSTGEDTWGTNRYGTSFTNSITQTISANNNSCAGKPYRPYTGTMVHKVANRTVTVLFGTNSSGTQIGTATTCGDGFYVTYQKNTRTAYVFVPYW